MESFYIHVEPSKSRPNGIEVVGIANGLDDPLFLFEADDCNITSHVHPGFDLSKKIRDFKNYSNIKIEPLTPAIKKIYLDQTGTQFMFRGKLLNEDGDSSSLRERSFQEINGSSSSGSNSLRAVRKASNSVAAQDDGLVDDLSSLKLKFQKLNLFNGDHQKFINEIEVHCIKSYPTIEQLTDKFFYFLEGKLLIWYYKLDLATETWATFKSQLIEQADCEHFNYLTMQLLEMNAFNAKLKEIRKNDSVYLAKLAAYPISTFVDEKLKLIQAINPGLSQTATMNIIVGGLNDTLKKKLFKFRKLDTASFIELCKAQDAIN